MSYQSIDTTYIGGFFAYAIITFLVYVFCAGLKFSDFWFLFSGACWVMLSFSIFRAAEISSNNPKALIGWGWALILVSVIFSALLATFIPNSKFAVVGANIVLIPLTGVGANFITTGMLRRASKEKKNETDK